MPTVLRIDGIRVVIYPNDHGPPHVHVIRNDDEAVFLLNCPGGTVELREAYGFRRRELTSIARVLDGHLALLCEAWREIHGEP